MVRGNYHNHLRMKKNLALGYRQEAIGYRKIKHGELAALLPIAHRLLPPEKV